MTMTRSENHRAVITLEISSQTEIASAQQRMCILVISRVRLRRDDEHHDDQYPSNSFTTTTQIIHDEKSTTISFPICGCNSGSETCQPANYPSSTLALSSLPPETFMRILDALHRDNNRIVLREWKQGACWWNLNMNQGTRYLIGNGVEDTRGLDSACTQHCDSTETATDKVNSALSMARAEVAGYRLAKMALDSYHDCDISERLRHRDSNEREDHRVYTPEVLYFSHDTCNCQNADNHCDIENHSPWALLSFFDNGFASELNKHHEQVYVEADYESFGVDNSWNTSSSICHGVVHSSRKNRSTVCPCHHFPTTMTKIRREFGFDEPHPRHGRVPTDECLDYAMMILRDVVMPIQKYFFIVGSANNNLMWSQPLVHNLRPIGWVDTKQPTQPVKSFQYHDMIEVHRHALFRLSCANAFRKENGGNDKKMDFMLNLLDKCVNALGCAWATSRPPPLPPVLCHMDLQPQNLFFCHTTCDTAINEYGGQHHNKQGHSASECSVASVMDWEEACFADPRFELLLICRKVLATREQAEQLWQYYSSRVRHMGECILSKRTTNSHWDIGSLEPWLKLETVHSLCTLLLQAMDLLGGGRNPWETTSDLWGKIDRERKRLVQMGWHFCDVSRESRAIVRMNKDELAIRYPFT